MADLLTVEEYKLFLKQTFNQVEESNERDLYYSNILLPGASEAVRRLTNQDFQSIARTDIFTVKERTEFLTLEFRPVTVLTEVKINGDVRDLTDYYLKADAVGIKSDTNLIALTANTFENGRIYWPLSFADILIKYTGGAALSRSDKWLIAKLIAKMDEEDRRTFTGVDEANAAVESEFENNRLFRALVARWTEHHL